MKAIENVWLYVDALAPAGDALGVAVEVSRRSGAALTLIGAIGRSEDRIFETSFGEQILQLVRKDREARVLALEASARSSLPRGRLQSFLLEGDVPWHSVAAHAGARAPDLLVVAARAGTGRGFDPVSQHLFRKCAVPVWSVYPGSGGFPRRALAAVYPGRAKSDERQVARRLIEVARRIAGAGPLELHVATAWTVPGEELLRGRLGEEDTQGYVNSLRENAHREMEELLAEVEVGAAAEVHLPKGDPASAIPALAERLGADLVLLGSAGRTGLAGLFIGSTAEEIISHVARSVLVVKPPGFVSPVRPSKHERATLLSAPGSSAR
jgi:nucleotide-binding universal stress UspA family protein